MVSQRRHGFTIVELLIGVSIVAALTAVTLPAIQASREAARLTTCRNNVTQLSKGLIQYEAYYSYFPSGGWSPQWVGVADRTGDSAQPGGWAFSMLPYIDELPTRNIVANVPASGVSTAYNKLMTTSLPQFSCPSRRTSQSIPLDSTEQSFQGGTLTIPRATRSDFAMNSGSLSSCPPVTAFRVPVATVKTVAVRSCSGRTCSKERCHEDDDDSCDSKKSSWGFSSLFSSSKDDDDDHERDDDEGDRDDDDESDDDREGTSSAARVVTVCQFDDGDYLGECSSCGSPVDAIMSHPKTLSEGDSWRKMSMADRVTKLGDRGIPDVQNGMCGRMSRLKSGHVSDGLSNTYLIGEKCVDSRTYGTGTDDGDDSPMLAGYSSDTSRWGSTAPCKDAKGVSNPTAFGSGHGAGWNVSYADGMVRTVSFTIDPKLHEQLSCRDNGPGVIAIPPK